jgi:hypothetical protein
VFEREAGGLDAGRGQGDPTAQIRDACIARLGERVREARQLAGWNSIGKCARRDRLHEQRDGGEDAKTQRAQGPGLLHTISYPR